MGDFKEAIEQRIDAYAVRKSLMMNYLIMKSSETDWHGTADAAMDLRDLEAAIIELKWVLEEMPTP